jgi:hypothetical protein
MDAMHPFALPLAALGPLASDAVFVGISVAFFTFALLFAWFCGKIR